MSHSRPLISLVWLLLFESHASGKLLCPSVVADAFKAVPVPRTLYSFARTIPGNGYRIINSHIHFLRTVLSCFRCQRA